MQNRKEYGLTAAVKVETLTFIVETNFPLKSWIIEKNFLRSMADVLIWINWRYVLELNNFFYLKRYIQYPRDDLHNILLQYFLNIYLLSQKVVFAINSKVC